MTDDDKKLREHTSMRLFNFYLDDLTKLQVLQKLRQNGLDASAKGTLAALMRVLLRQFAESDNAEWIDAVCREVEEEYIFTTKKNKRSKL